MAWMISLGTIIKISLGGIIFLPACLEQQVAVVEREADHLLNPHRSGAGWRTFETES